MEAADEDDDVSIEPMIPTHECLSIVEDAICGLLSCLDSDSLVLFGRDLCKNPTLFLRSFSLLLFCYDLLISGRQVSQRDIYYQMPHTLPTPNMCNAELDFLARSLRVSRISLNVYASSRGMMAGKIQLLIQQQHEEEDSAGKKNLVSGFWSDLSLCGPNGHSISGNMMECSHFRSDGARFILMVEKEGVFHELHLDRIYGRIPCVVVTAHGFPDVATRAMVSRMSEELRIPVIGLCDFNPGGLAIMLTLRWGARSKKAEATMFPCPNFFWLGILAEDIDGLEGVPLTQHDMHRLNYMKQDPRVQHLPCVLQQMQAMENVGVRIELQAIRSTGMSITEWVLKKILRQSWIAL